jgi:hypothetical protein
MQSEWKKQTKKPFDNTLLPFVYSFMGIGAFPTLSALKRLLQ